MDEPHYTPDQLAAWWHVSGNTIRRLFRNVVGVMILNHPEELHKRGHASMRIPASVAQRVYEQHMQRKSK
jgi:hypothetical protein